MAKGLIRGEVRLCHFPHPDKDRPVVILTRDTVIDRLNNVTVAPITSTIRGVASEVSLDVADGMKGPCAVNLHNIATVSKTHIGRTVAVLSGRKLEEVCTAMVYALGCT